MQHPFNDEFYSCDKVHVSLFDDNILRPDFLLEMQYVSFFFSFLSLPVCNDVILKNKIKIVSSAHESNIDVAMPVCKRI